MTIDQERALSNTASQGRTAIEASLVSPCCKAPVEQSVNTLTCTCCGWEMPIVRGVPILIFDERSVFSVADFTAGHEDDTNINFHDASESVRSRT